MRLSRKIFSETRACLSRDVMITRRMTARHRSRHPRACVIARP
jgi:hypothetical protein